MSELEKFKKFRDTKLAKISGNKKGYYILDNKTCEAIVNAYPLTLADLGKVSGIKKGTKTFETYGEAIVEYFTTSSQF